MIRGVFEIAKKEVEITEREVKDLRKQDILRKLGGKRSFSALLEEIVAKLIALDLRLSSVEVLLRSLKNADIGTGKGWPEYDKWVNVPYTTTDRTLPWGDSTTGTTLSMTGNSLGMRGVDEVGEPNHLTDVRFEELRSALVADRREPDVDKDTLS